MLNLAVLDYKMQWHFIKFSEPETVGLLEITTITTNEHKAHRIQHQLGAMALSEPKPTCCHLDLCVHISMKFDSKFIHENAFVNWRL